MAATKRSGGEGETPRKGARTIATIPPAILRQLNAGELAAANLVEALAIDFGKLMHAVTEGAVDARAIDPSEGITRRMSRAGRLLYAAYGARGFQRFARHRSDTVRGWAAYVLAETPRLPIARKLELMKPLADDSNSGVREWAWLALRGELIAELEPALAALLPWTGNASANLRRFASEATRPRGVWCAHIEALKRDPELALGLLEPLRADPARYVQDSVSNWLNDASKSRPDWVRELCGRWNRESAAPATERIVRRALRSL